MSMFFGSAGGDPKSRYRVLQDEEVAKKVEICVPRQPRRALEAKNKGLDGTSGGMPFPSSKQESIFQQPVEPSAIVSGFDAGLETRVFSGNTGSGLPCFVRQEY